MASSRTILAWLSAIRSPAAAVVVPSWSVRNLTRGTAVGDSIDLADRGPRRRKGLLGHTELPRGEGLWIVPCEGVHTFFMKFAIDLVYLDRARKVVKVRGSVAPWRISLCLRAHSILELPAGTILATNTRAGDEFEMALSTQASTVTR